MCLYTTATPADVTESDSTTDSTSTLPDSTTVLYDSRQNEVDTKFLKGEETTTSTTVSDVVEKIESIESDFAERAIKTSDDDENDFEPESSHTTDESSTIEIDPDANLGSERISQMDKATTMTGITQKSRQSGETHEPEKDSKFERATNDESDKEESTSVTTSSATQTTTSQVSTTSTTTAKPKLSPAVKHDKEKSELTERAKTLQQIKQMLKAHVLRTVLTSLNEAKKRQQSQTQELLTQESKVVEDSVHAASGHKCEYEENVDVSTDDDDKIIAFDKDSQRYVYMDKEDYERLLASHRSSHVISRFAF